MAKKKTTTKAKTPTKRKKVVKTTKNNEKKYVNHLLGALPFEYDPEEVIVIPETKEKVKAKNLPLMVLINLKSK
ncbi:hypothetical protein CCP1ISM_250009 [Azospirillaceae bacterium]